MTDQLSELSAGAANYRSGIRSAANGLWLGVMDYDQFYDAMDSVIRRGIPQAYYEGAEICGIQPNELTPEERQEIKGATWRETSFIDGFAIFIEQHTKAKEGKWGTVKARVNTWVNRYSQIKQQAMTMACSDLKTRWTLGVAEHCDSCVRLAGKVKRNSYWQRTGILPRVPGAPYLQCRGYNCQCTLEPTEEPLSKGPLPKLS